ncbi:tail associated lysin [Staphylococcus phage PG-2021_76]
MNDNYRLNISGDSRDLERSLQTIIAMMDAIEERDLGKSVEGFGEKLREIAKLTKEVQNISSKNQDSSFVSAKDMNDTIQSTKEATKLIQEFQKALQDVQNQRISDGMAPDQEVIKTFEKLEGVLGSTKQKMDSMSSVTVGKDGSINSLMKDMERLGSLTDDFYNSTERAREAQERLSQVRATRNRVKRNLEKSEVTNNMTYDQGVQTKQALNSVNTFKNDRQRFSEEIDKTRKSYMESKGSHQQLANDFSEGRIDKKTYEKERAQIEATINARAKEIKNMEALQRELEKTINYFEGSAQQEFSTRTSDAQRGTYERMMQERAPSIGSHAVMGGLAVGAGMYLQGKGLSESNRPYKVALGQQMGESDYTGLRTTFAKDSIDNKLGLTGTDMLQLAEQYNASAGYTSQEDTRSATVELGTGMRSMGIANSEAYKESMASLIHTGGISGGMEIKDMQNAFIGGLKESGMVGRNEEQLKALTTIAEQNSQGRTLTNKEMDNLTATQAVLAGTGSKGLQGEQGAQFMTGLDQGIRGASGDAYNRLAMGWGTEYQGITGMREFDKQAQKGISDPDNLQNFYDVAMSQGATSEDQKAYFYQNMKNLNPETTVEQSDELFKLMDRGDLSEKELKKRLKDMEDKGSKEKDKNSEDYKNSDEGKNDQNKAKFDKLAEDIYDLAQPMRNLHGATMSLPAPFYLLGASAVALAMSFAKSMAMMKGSEMLTRGGVRGSRSRMAGKNAPKGGGNTPKGGGLAGWGSAGMAGLAGMFGMDSPEGGGKQTKGMPSFGGGATDSGGSNNKGGMFGRIKDFFGKNDPTGGSPLKDFDTLGKDSSKGGRFSNIGDKLKNFAKGSGSKLKGFGKSIWNGAKDPSPGGFSNSNKLVSGAGKAGGLLKKVPYLGVGLMAGEGIARTLGGEDGNQVGGDIASGFLDPLGLGYGKKVGDNLAEKGKKAGENPVGWGEWKKGDRGLVGNAVTGAWDGIKGIFGGNKAEASEKGGSVSGKSYMEEGKKSPMKARMDAERLREKNNTSETENLQTYRGLLDRFEQLIQEAKSLDIGGGSSEGSDSSSEGKSASEIGGTGAKKIWGFFKDKGLSDSQISALMGNLQQESNLDPNAVNGDSGAFGIAQWLGSRKTGLENFAKSKGKKKNDLDVQLDYLWKEMNTDYESNNLKNAGWSKNGSVSKNTSAFAYGFERMGRDEAMMSTREKNAKSFKEKYGGGGSGGFDIPSSLSTPVQAYSSTPTNSTENTTNHNNNVNINVTVEGGSNPEETGDLVGNAIASRISSLDVFTNQQRRK